MNLNQLQRAFEIFRYLYGVAANPEDYPDRWDFARRLAEQQTEQEDDQ